jgi:hypothetical protein
VFNFTDVSGAIELLTVILALDSKIKISRAAALYCYQALVYEICILDAKMSCRSSEHCGVWLREGLSGRLDALLAIGSVLRHFQRYAETV